MSTSIRRCLIFIFIVVCSDSGAACSADSALVFMSDTQSPMWIEAIAVSRNKNEEATAMLFTHILNDSLVGMVALLGDVTERSSSEKVWGRIDSILVRFQSKGIPIVATMGNHDYLVRASKGEQQFIKRFPSYKRTGYCVRFKSLAIVLLNSNYSILSAEERTFQKQWYEQVLDSLQSDSTVAAVLVGCHHPPYTNNTVVGPSKEVERDFVPAFLAHSKCKVFLSGHSHAFEHFREGGKDFIVLGGGGGLQHTLLLGKKQLWYDHFPHQTEKRMFHYVRCTVQECDLLFTVFMVKSDFSAIETVATFSVSLRNAHN
ncbi:MAG: metallophosphoesterase [Bacteroidetes bacterium]|nr:metallophosphoesterase [Bacteroidota bacterium]